MLKETIQLKKKAPIRFFDLFAGIGGFRAGLTRSGGYECIGHCEMDPHAERAYRAIHPTKESEVSIEDATKLNPAQLPDFDLLCAGFPCQSFSISGKRRGFEDPRGAMFFEITRILKRKHPPYVLFENVPGLLSHDAGRTFAYIIHSLCELGYCCEWQVLNSKDFGVPQSRCRVYLAAFLDKRCAGKIFPVRRGNPARLICLINTGRSRRIYDTAGLSPTLLARQNSTIFYVRPQNRFRRLTPQECLRLQGFSEEDVKKLLSVVSPSQAYKQSGNAVTVDVVYAIGKNLRETHQAYSQNTNNKRGIQT